MFFSNNMIFIMSLVIILLILILVLVYFLIRFYAPHLLPQLLICGDTSSAVVPVTAADGVTGTQMTAFERNEEIERDLQKEQEEKGKLIKVLLLGTGESGKSTFLKQMKIIHNKGFQPKEMQHFHDLIRNEMATGFYEIVNGMDELDIPFVYNETEIQAVRLQETGNEVATPGNIDWLSVSEAEIYEKVFYPCLVLWEDEAVRDAFERADDLKLSYSTRYFIPQVRRIVSPVYEPSDQDILHLRVKTTGVIELRFPHKGLNFRMFDVGGQRSERKKWIHLFDDVFTIMFCAALSEYDMKLEEDPTKNRAEESIHLFSTLLDNPYFAATPFMLFLNKKDVFQKQLAKSPLNLTFSGYTGGDNFEEASNFIEDLYISQNKTPGRQIFVHKTIATDTNQMKFVWESVSNTIISLNLAHTGIV